MTDWRIKDWAFDKQSLLPFRVMQVTGLLYDCVMLENGNEDNVEPLPLCGEYLEANGWEWKVPNWVLKGKPVRLGWNPDAKKFYIGYGELPNPVKFVHQVQHILRICGLFDEADNFKLETCDCQE